MPVLGHSKIKVYLVLFPQVYCHRERFDVGDSPWPVALAEGTRSAASQTWKSSSSVIAAAHRVQCRKGCSPQALCRNRSRVERRFLTMLKRNESGQTLVEVAISLSVFLMLVLGTIDFGYMFSTKLTLQNAVRQAGRYAITGQCLSNPDGSCQQTQIQLDHSNRRRRLARSREAKRDRPNLHA